VRLESHDEMRRQWERYPEMSGARVPYTTLKQQSEAARYYLKGDFRAGDLDHLVAQYKTVKRVVRPKKLRAIDAARS
jgi:hypothetical protein